MSENFLRKTYLWHSITSCELIWKFEWIEIYVSSACFMCVWMAMVMSMFLFFCSFLFWWFFICAPICLAEESQKLVITIFHFRNANAFTEMLNSKTLSIVFIDIQINLENFWPCYCERVSFGNSVAKLNGSYEAFHFNEERKMAVPARPNFSYNNLPRFVEASLSRDDVAVLFLSFAVFYVSVVVSHNSTYIKMMNWNFLLLLTFRRIV